MRIRPFQIYLLAPSLLTLQPSDSSSAKKGDGYQAIWFALGQLSAPGDK